MVLQVNSLFYMHKQEFLKNCQKVFLISLIKYILLFLHNII